MALKLLKSGGATFGDNIERLKREFRTLADVVHPNLVGLHELVCEGRHWFITMDLVEGSEFIDYLDGGAATADEPVSDRAPTMAAPKTTDILREERLRDALRQLVSAVGVVTMSGTQMES